jgi:hypothetical protein
MDDRTMFKTSWLVSLGAVWLLLAPAAMAQQAASHRNIAEDAAYDRGYEAGYAAAMKVFRRRPTARADDRPGYVSEYTRYSPYAAQNRPQTSISPAVSAHRARTDIRGRNELDGYLDYPADADYHHRRAEDVAPRGRIYDPGDFRDEQGGIYGNRGVLMWTDRYDAGDYANKFWNTHRDNVYAGQRVWNTNNGDQ